MVLPLYGQISPSLGERMQQIKKTGFFEMVFSTFNRDTLIVI